jgi:hypothetical protein
MNFPLVICLVGVVFAVGMRAAEAVVSDPPELQTRRLEHLRAMQKASVPLLTNYQKSLQGLKEQFTRQGKLEAALAVDKELKTVTSELESATATAQGNVHSLQAPLTIVSATYEGPEPGQKFDATKRLQKVFDEGKGSTTIKEVVGAADPAPFKKKTMTIEYSINGQVKKKVYGQGGMINFREDLK